MRLYINTKWNNWTNADTLDSIDICWLLSAIKTLDNTQII